MTPRIAIVSATETEIRPFLDFLLAEGSQHSFQTFHLRGLQIDIIYTGIGVMQTTYALTDYVSHRHPAGWIQAGIGGAFSSGPAIGEVYLIESEMLAGFGAEDLDGRILDPFELGWNDPDAFPFSNGVMMCPFESNISIPKATGMTTWHAHGYAPQIEAMRRSPHADIENMEGAPFFYVSLIRRIPFLSLRSISNRVEPRDKSKWKMDLAVQHLSQTLKRLLEASRYHPPSLFRPL